jgi:hypothetical protein
MQKQIESQARDSEQARRAVISGQNQALIARLNDLVGELNNIRDKVIEMPTYVHPDTNYHVPRLGGLSVRYRAGIDIDQINGLWDARSKLETAYKRFRRSQRQAQGEEAETAKVSVLDRVSGAHEVIHDLILLLNGGEAVSELRMMTPDELHRESGRQTGVLEDSRERKH